MVLSVVVEQDMSFSITVQDLLGVPYVYLAILTTAVKIVASIMSSITLYVMHVLVVLVVVVSSKTMGIILILNVTVFIV